jgi:Na+(H+)/acetate symporter ActP
VVQQGWIGLLLYRPAVVTVPVAFLTMVVVSRFTRASIPRDVDRALMILHAPEQLGLSRDRFDRPGRS